ncbi:MAG: hypothetical protein JW976_06855 [Syntrophaceae bacterium]|nr:hypothetical protein [Syntrophaceae bacterium]
MLEGPSRYEVNRRVRQTMVSHNVDLTKINYSFINRTVYIYGRLVKESREDFSISSIKNLVDDLMKLPRIRKVQFDLDNWVICTEPGELNIIKGRGVGSVSTMKHHDR